MKTKGHIKNEDSKNRKLERDREALKRKGNFETALIHGIETSDPVYLHRTWIPFLFVFTQMQVKCM